MSDTLGFDRHAASYDTNAQAQQAFAAELLTRCERHHGLRGRVVDLGCGTGQLTSELRTRFPDTAITGVDASTDMLAIARERDSAVTWTATDLLTFHDSEGFDFAVSSSALHWIAPLSDAIAACATLLKPGAPFECVLMLDGTLGELHASRRHAAPEVPPLSTLPSEATVMAAFHDTAFEVVDTQALTHVEHFDSAQAAMRAFRRQGVTGGSISQGARPLTRGELYALEDHYATQFPGQRGGVVATYRGLAISARRR